MPQKLNFDGRMALAGLLALVHLAGCGIGSNPDPRTIDGMMGYAALAIERDDPEMLFKVIDERARHALISIVADRQAAAALIRAHYPAADQAGALQSLGDALDLEDAWQLFAARCDQACRRAWSTELGAVQTKTADGEEWRVTTTRGAEVRVYREHEGEWWGLVWRTAELDAERDRANRDLEMIRQNAETYQRREALEHH